MDGQRFDRATRALATGISRRHVLRGLGGALLGTALATRVRGEGAEAARKPGPDPCAAYCAGEPGPRGAQCRQACKACGGPSSPGFCQDETTSAYVCCEDGLQCFLAWTEEGRIPACCAEAGQVCQDASWQPYCCPDGEYCAEHDLCCPSGITACFDVCTDDHLCGHRDQDWYCSETSCRDRCTWEYVCGIADSTGFCAGTACWSPCSSQYECGEPDENGNCAGTSCYDPVADQYRCEPSCYDPAYGGEVCGYESCFDPELDMTVCGSSCYDPSSDSTICGPSCWDQYYGRRRCGEQDEAGNCPSPCPGQTVCDLNGPVCCDDPPGCCYDPSLGQTVCGTSCWDSCYGQGYICGDRDPNDWHCRQHDCFDPCLEQFVCGEADDDGNCVNPACP
jgi:hypothetical protein